ncbi:LuxR C-terminal-related transcriptional regulator [Streptomyces sp. NPDC058861]|uniref:helix-turn-helix transcriptional regulator n=1 Tax=Streptomyces sp. NPDC058861 TaxID=3346653 RepID=UPI00369696D1
MLEPLGLDSAAERLYKSMLAHPQEDLAALSARLGVDEQVVHQSLHALSTLALVRPSLQEGGGYRAVSPEIAMEMILSRQQADLAAQQLRIETSRAAAAQLIAECSALTVAAAGSGGDAERLIGVDVIRERLAVLASQAEQEITTFAPGGAHPAADLEASRRPNAALLDRGVRMRTIYLDSVRNHAPTLEHVNWLSSRGGQVRTAATLPVRMVIIDRRQVVLPLDTSDARTGAVLLKGDGIVAALYALFESTWAAATPLGNAPVVNQHDLSNQEAEILRLLDTGLTDEVIAKRLGVSPRTARRLTALLMERLEARSRFEAGANAVRLGWLSLTP